MIRSILCVTLILPVLHTPAQQQTSKSADVLLHQALEAQGGEAKLRALRSITIETEGYRNMLEQSERPEGLGRLRRNAFLIVFIVAGQTTGHTQTAAPAVDPNTFLFEVVSIHPDAPGEMSGMTRIMFERSRYEAEHVTVKELIREAYGVEDLQIQQAPKWLDTDTFSVDASMDRATADALSGLSEDQSRAARQHMLQALLADRFRLILGRETKELSVFSLAFAKGDAGLKKADPANTYSNGVE